MCPRAYRCRQNGIGRERPISSFRNRRRTRRSPSRSTERPSMGRFAPAPEENAGFTFAFGSCHYPFEVDDAGVAHLRKATRIYPAIRDDLCRARCPLPASDRRPALCRRGSAAECARRAARRRRSSAAAGSAGRCLPPGRPAAISRNVGSGRCAKRCRPSACGTTTISSTIGAHSKRKRPSMAASSPRPRAVYGEYQDGRNPGGGQTSSAVRLLLSVRHGRVSGDGCRGARSLRREPSLRPCAMGPLRRVHARGGSAAAPHAVRRDECAGRARGEAGSRCCSSTSPASTARRCATAGSPRRFVTAGTSFCDTAFRLAGRARRTGRSCCSPATSTRRMRSRSAGVAGRARSGNAPAAPSPRRQRCTLRRFNWIATRFPNLFESRFRFDRKFLLPKNNVGLVRLTARPGGGHDIRYTVRAWDANRARLFDAETVDITPGS